MKGFIGIVEAALIAVIVLMASFFIQGPAILGPEFRMMWPTSYVTSNIGFLDYYIQLNPQSWQAYSTRAQAYLFVHRYQAALDDCNKAIELAPNELQLYHFRGECRYWLEDFNGARNDLLRVAERPFSADDLIMLSVLFLKDGQSKLAEQYGKKAVESDPLYGPAYGALALANCALGNFDKALELCKTGKELQANCSLYIMRQTNLIFYASAWALNATGRSEEALTDAFNGVMGHTICADSYYYRGMTYASLKSYPLAIRDFTQALSLTTHRAQIYEARARAYVENQEYGRALADCDQAIMLQPELVQCRQLREKIVSDSEAEKAASTRLQSLINKSLEGIRHASTTDGTVTIAKSQLTNHNQKSTTGAPFNFQAWLAVALMSIVASSCYLQRRPLLAAISKRYVVVPLFAILAVAYIIATAMNVITNEEQWLITLTLLLIGLIAARFRTPIARNILYLDAIFATIRYCTWRTLYTLNFDDPFSTVASLLMYYAELHCWCVVLSVWFFLWKLPLPDIDEDHLEAPPRPPDFQPTVDIFITTMSEPLNVISKTVAAALSIRYANKKVYVLDDGNRPQCRELAKVMGCEYLTRTERKFHKAGNLINALKIAKGEYVLILDADHVAANTILDNTLGYFLTDEKICAVQTAHAFLNPAPIEKNLQLAGVLPTEMVREHIWGMALDQRNSYYWDGSGAIFRRKALDEIGGIGTGTLVEDRHTTILLQKLGYWLAFFPVPQTLALNPETLAHYLNQRRRWFRGTLQVFVMCNPLLTKGLTFSQRLCHLLLMLDSCSFIPRILFLISLPLSLFFHVYPFKVVGGAPPAEQLAYFALLIGGFSYAFRHRQHSFYGEIYDLLRTPAYCYELFEAFVRRKKPVFKATHEASEKLVHHTFPIHLAMFQLIVLGIVTYSLLTCILLTAQGYDMSIVIFWLVWQLVMLVNAVFVALHDPEPLERYGVETDLTATLSTQNNGSFETRLTYVSEYGGTLQVAGPDQLEAGQDFTLHLTAPSQDDQDNLITLSGEVISVSNNDSSLLIEFKFIDVATNFSKISQFKRFIDLTLASNKAWQRRRGKEPQDSMIRAWSQLLSTPFRVLANLMKKDLKIVFRW